MAGTDPHHRIAIVVLLEVVLPWVCMEEEEEAVVHLEGVVDMAVVAVGVVSAVVAVVEVSEEEAVVTVDVAAVVVDGNVLVLEDHQEGGFMIGEGEAEVGEDKRESVAKYCPFSMLISSTHCLVEELRGILQF